jgi:23S rRNA (adenine2030-N6)-methyltransferase
LLAPYLDAVRALNPAGGLTFYPGSPKLSRMLLRGHDRLSLMELHPADFEELHRNFEGDFQTRATHLDGWLAMNAHLPPKEKRGLILVDPPFELAGEYKRLVDNFAKAYRKFPTGVYCLWYPLKDGAPIAEFHNAFAELEIPKILCAELSVKSERDTTGLSGSGLIIVNPPFTLKGELDILLPYLKEKLAQDRFGSATTFWIRGE